MALIEKGMQRPQIDDDFFNDLNFTKSSLKIASAKELIAKLNIKSFPVDLYKILQDLNIEYDEEVLPRDTSGKLEKNEGKDTYKIIVNKLHPQTRKNFTIAHEIAHFCLHKNLKEVFEDQTFFRNEKVDPMETEANTFAAELLMPEQEFSQRLNSGINTISELSEEFDVSTLAVRVRAKQLGLGGHGL